MSDAASKTTRPALFNKRLDPDGVELLARLYRSDKLSVALLCDEHLDKSGALLGDVRSYARSAESV